MKLTNLLKENEEKRPLSNEVKKHFLEIVSTYTKYQEMMDRKSDLTTIAETLGGITEAARTLALTEGDDWFDKVTVKRNMNELDKLGKEFDKCATEANSLDQRLNGLYEDMGHILSRYYKVGEITEEKMKERLGMKEKEVKEAGGDINKAPIPGDVKMKLDRALDVLNGKKLTYAQKLQVMGRVLDSLGIDKKELNKVTQKIRTKLESSHDNIEEVSYDSQGNLKVKKQYRNLSDYENVAKKGDYIWVGNNPNSFKGAGKELLSKVLGKDSEGNIILTPFGRNKKYTISQKNQSVVVVESVQEKTLKEVKDLTESEMKIYQLGEKVEKLMEKNCPSDPGKWSASKAAAKSKFDVYPSAYANGWASKNYKAKGGRWRKCKD